jgi:CRISPR-associated protein Csm2
MKKIVLDYRKDSELFSETAKEWAKLIESHKCADERGRLKWKKTKKSQIRNFYDKVLKLYQDSKKKDSEWEDIIPFVKMLNSKVAYAETRDVVNCAFVDMMNQCITQIDSEEKLEVYKLFFEAVLGFYKGKD